MSATTPSDQVTRCLQQAAATTDPERQQAWRHLARMWAALINEQSLSPQEHDVEVERLLELEALAAGRHQLH